MRKRRMSLSGLETENIKYYEFDLNRLMLSDIESLKNSNKPITVLVIRDITQVLKNQQRIIDEMY